MIDLIQVGGCTQMVEGIIRENIKFECLRGENKQRKFCDLFFSAIIPINI